jgi:tetratricopeptide (TPR) repeat protein/TolB-like protein
LTAERWQRIKVVFQTAAELEPDQRAAYLHEACAGEAQLRQEVESLLAASGEAEDFIEEPALQQGAATLIENLPDPMIGSRIGAYKVAGEVGRGGMGAVYRAIRDDDHFQQQVAIKIVKRGIDTDFILRRFRSERQILAGLEHPNIACLLDGGATSDGLPYYVMEYIEGRPIDEYCNAQKLTTAQRLTLFVSVCSAVHFAHQKMVVHRDIKPGNILITRAGVPKLLDFGIAKILDPALAGGPGAPTLTQTALRMMTPAYASPEQIRGGAVTPASDVYSLGVLLYELLTGRRPYELKGRAPHELAQVVCETEPEKPSTAVGRSDKTRKLRQSLEGDLDGIVLMAMRKDPLRRYGSAEAFAHDIQRHLDGLPVRARDDTPGYRLGKWIQRRKASTAAAAVILAMAGAFGWQAYRARAPGTAAQVKARPSIAVLGFKNLSGKSQSDWLSTALTEMLSTELAAGEQVRAISGETVAQVKMDLALSDTDSFSRDTLSRIRNNLGADYVVLGSYLFTSAGENGIRLDLRLQDAVAGETVVTASDTGRESDLPALVARAGARVRQKLGVNGVSGADAERARAMAPSNPAAARLYSEGLRRLRISDTLAAKDFLQRAAAADPNHALTRSSLALALTSLGEDAAATKEAKKAFDLSQDLSRENRMVVEGSYYETVNAWDKATAIYRALYGFFPDTIDYGIRLASAQTSSAKAPDALKTLEELRRLPPPARDDPRIDVEEGNAAAATSDYKRVLAAAARAEMKGAAHGSRILVARAKILKGRALTELEQTDAAIEALEEARAIYAQVGHQRGVARALNSLANLKRHLGDLEGAKRLHEQALAISREIGSLDGIAEALNSIAITLKQQGDFNGAKKTYREALAIRRQIGEKDGLSRILNNLANALVEQGELTEVKAMYSQVLAIARESGSKRNIARALNNLGLAMRHECGFAEAKKMYEESLAIRRQLGDTTGVAMVLHNVAEVLEDQGDLAGAKKSELESLAIQRKQKNKRGQGYALWALGNFSLAEGDLKAAGEYQREAVSVRNEIGEKNTEAQSKVALAVVSFEEGNLDMARRLAQQAAVEFRAEKAAYLEASAQAVLALALATQKKSREAQKAIDRGTVLARKIEIKEVRLSTATLLARANALLGKRPEAERSLEALLAEAVQLGLVAVQFNIRLALAELEIESGDTAKGRARLMALRSDAAGKGYGLVARKAAALWGRLIACGRFSIGLLRWSTTSRRPSENRPAGYQPAPQV